MWAAIASVILSYLMESVKHDEHPHFSQCHRNVTLPSFMISKTMNVASICVQLCRESSLSVTERWPLLTVSIIHFLINEMK